MILNIRRFVTADSVDLKIVTDADPKGLKIISDEVKNINTQIESTETRFENLQKTINTINAETPLEELKKLASSMKGVSTRRQTLQKRVSYLRENKGILNSDNKSGIAKAARSLGILRSQETLLKESSAWTDLEKTINATAKAQRNNADASKENAKALEEVGDDGKRTKDVVASLEKGFRSLALVKLTYLWRSIRRVSSTLVSMVESAAEYEESLNLYRMALGSYAEEANKWATRISDALLLDPSAIMQYTGAFYNLTKGLGATSKAAYTMATNLTQLTYDMSSYLNISVEAANQKLQSAMSGQARAIQGVGVAIQAATLQELAHSLGIKKSVSVMTQAEKTYLRYIQIMRSTKQMQGDLGRTMITPANAIRILKTQISLLGRAIGQVLTPIIMNAIPYLMAFTNALTKLAKQLADLLGYKIADIDYSNVKSAADAYDDYGDAVEGAAGKVRRSLAPFDELNVVESTSTGTGVGEDTVLDQLEQYISGYDMLEDYTDALKRKAEALEPAITGVLKGIGIAFGAFTAYKAVTKVQKWIKDLKDNKLVKALKTKLLPGIKSVIAKTGSDFGSLAKNIQGALGPLGSVVGVLGTSIAAFKSTGDIIKKTNPDLQNLNAQIAKSAAVGVGLTVVGGLLGGIPGLAVVAAASLLGISDGLTQVYDDFAWKEGYDTLFDGVGRSIKSLEDQMTDSYSYFEGYITEQQKLADNVDIAKQSVTNAKEQVKLLTDELERQNTEPTQEQINNLKAAYDNLKKALDDQIYAEKAQEDARLRQLHELGAVTDEEYENMIKSAKKYYETEALLTAGYSDELQKLELQYQRRQISEEEYAKKLEDIRSRYYGVNGSIDDVSSTLQGYIEMQSQKWDFSNYEDVKANIQKIIDKTGELKNENTTYYNNNRKDIEEDIETAERKIATLEGIKATQGELSKEQETALENAKNHLADLNTELDKNEQHYKDTNAELESTLKYFLLSVGAQMDTTSEDIDFTNRNLQDVLKTIKSGLEGIKDADADTPIKKFYKDMDESITNEGKIYSQTWSTVLQSVGETSAAAFGVGAVISVKDSYHAIESQTFDTMYSATTKAGYNLIADKNWVNAIKGVGETTGGYFGTGIGVGISEEGRQIAEDARKGIDVAEGYIKNYYGIHSPSTVWADHIGKYLGQGIGEGIEEASTYVGRSAKTLIDSVAKEFKNASFSIKIDTNIESSFNSMLSKLQTFCDNWRSAVNSLMSNMKNTMNGISLNTDGKLSYSSIPKVTVKKFEDGGFAQSGDFFFMNENGKAEFMASMGNKTAVYNQDQMVNALTNAIISGFNSMAYNSNGGTTNIYIDGKKVYSGQNEYQNREADRYGTATIRV